MHLVDPALDICPLIHGIGSCLELKHEWPAGHCMHSIFPGRAKSPTAQSTETPEILHSTPPGQIVHSLINIIIIEIEF